MTRLAFRLLPVLLVVNVVLGAAPSGHAQPTATWTVKYLPALRPAFQADMDAHLDAPRYTIRMTLDLGARTVTLAGTQEVAYTNRLPDISLDEIVFRLYPNLPSYGAAMQVSDVTVDGAAVDPALSEGDTVLTVPLPEVLAPGDSATLKLNYTIVLPAGQLRLYGQFSYREGVLALPNAYPVLSVYEPGSGWWTVAEHAQGDAVYSETAFYNVTITAPAELDLVTSGSAVDREAHDDGTLTQRFVAPLMRDFVVIGSAKYETLSGEQDGVAIRVHYLPLPPYGEQGARDALRITQQTVALFDETFGEYPFSELDVVETPTTAGGIEYPGVFVVAANIWERGDQTLQFVTVHEAAHQWWYSLVGNDQTLDPWLDEGLAQFSTAVYIRAKEGEQAYQRAIESFRAQYERYAQTFPEQPIGKPAAAYDNNGYYFYVYQKAPVFFATLAEKVGYDRLLAALRDYFAAYEYGIAEPEDLLTSLEQSLNVDLDTLFETWVGDVPQG